MSRADEIALWVRYYQRREAEGFGSTSDLRPVRRQQVIDYIRGHSGAAYAAITGGAA